VYFDIERFEITMGDRTSSGDQSRCHEKGIGDDAEIYRLRRRADMEGQIITRETIVDRLGSSRRTDAS
jgi:hypothetical protein